MAQWQHKVDFKDLFEKYDKGGIGVSETCREVAIRLKNLHAEIKAKNSSVEIEHLDELQDIIDEFETLSECDSTVEDFDSVLANLYDWADTRLDNQWGGKALCWVKTF